MEDQRYQIKTRQKMNRDLVIVDNKVFLKFIIKMCKNCGKSAKHRFNSCLSSGGVPQYRSICTDCRNIAKNDHLTLNRKENYCSNVS